MDNTIKNELNELKKYCYDYIKEKYGEKQNYIRKTRITKNGLFIYGCIFYIYTFISRYDSSHRVYVNETLDYFVEECKNSYSQKKWHKEW